MSSHVIPSSAGLSPGSSEELTRALQSLENDSSGAEGRPTEGLGGTDHVKQSVVCFNLAWDLLDLPARTAAQDERMLALGIASLQHWRLRPDVQPRHLATGCWQISRICAARRREEDATRFASMCREASAGEGPFHLGYAHEALARAARLRNDLPAFQTHLEQARAFSTKITADDERALLDADLEQLGREQLP